MEKLLATGKTKAIGVSNFGKAQLDRLIKRTSVVPAVHQLEGHPWLQQRSFMDWHKAKGIHVTHYSPFGNQNELYSSKVGHQLGKLIDEPVLAEVAKKYNKTPAQVVLGKFPLKSNSSWRRRPLTMHRTFSLGRHTGPLGTAKIQDPISNQSQPRGRLSFG
jgi:aryl-alcohol dehydrogenase-like predicted oxidoreductase